MGFAVKRFGAIFAGSIHGDGWVYRYGTASWNHAMKAKASSCSTTAFCEQPCPATTPPIILSQFLLSFLLPSISPAQSDAPYPRPFPVISLLPLPLTSFISHHPLRSLDRAATAGTYLLANPPRQSGSSQWLQRGIRLAQKEKKTIAISIEIVPRLQTAPHDAQPLAPR